MYEGFKPTLLVINSVKGSYMTLLVAPYGISSANFGYGTNLAQVAYLTWYDDRVSITDSNNVLYTNGRRYYYCLV